LITEELKKLASGDVVKFEVSVSQKEYKRAREDLIRARDNKDKKGKFVVN
jgi:hypothetical protein